MLLSQRESDREHPGRVRDAPANKEAALFYLDAMLDPEGCAKAAQAGSQVPAISNAPLSPDVRRKIALPDEPRAKLQIPDPGRVAAEFSSWVQWWGRDYKG